MLKLGELLKTQRRNKGLTISRASESTKIPQKLITALEQDNFDEFSSEVYLQGFLKNYAKFLGVNVNQALALYRRERESYKEQSFKDAQKPITEPNPIVTPGRLVFVFTVVIVLVVISFIVVQVNKIAQPPYLELREPAQGVAPSELYTEVNSDSIALYGKIEAGSKLLINGSEVNTNNLQEFRVDNFKLTPGSNEIYIVAKSYYFSKSSEIKLTVTANYESTTSNEDTLEEESESAQEETQEPESEKMNIKIEVGPDSAWIVATVDDITKISEVVEGGGTFEFEAEEIFTIYSPRPQMVKLTINEEEYTFSSQTATIFKIVNGSVVQE